MGVINATNLATASKAIDTGNQVAGATGKTKTTAGAALGGAAKGLAVGATVGSVVPVVGTVIGGVVGGVVGAVVGIFGNKKKADASTTGYDAFIKGGTSATGVVYPDKDTFIQILKNNKIAGDFIADVQKTYNPKDGTYSHGDWKGLITKIDPLTIDTFKGAAQHNVNTFPEYSAAAQQAAFDAVNNPIAQANSPSGVGGGGGGSSAQNAVFGGTGDSTALPRALSSALINRSGNTGIAGGLIASAVNSSTVQNAAKSLGVEIKTTEDSWWSKQSDMVKGAIIVGGLILAFFGFKFFTKKGR
jgi:hypothetical protein